MANSAFDAALGEKIRVARAEARMSQEKLAERIGSTQNAISEYEHGTRSIPLRLLMSIARELEKPLSYFLDCSGDLVVVKNTKLYDVIVDIQSSNAEINLLYEIWNFVHYRKRKPGH